MYKKNRNWFTLVELIVVITILAILWTIAFISLQWYSKSTRDSKRLSDLNNFRTTVELYQVSQWRYPDPDNAWDITYSWSVVRSQWTVWESVVRQLKWLPSIPYDPLTETEYTYSVLNTKKEYQIWTIFEDDSLSSKIVNKSYALDKEKALAHILWTYNWVAAKVSTWETTFVLSVPSIICL
jgi:prepilin-type N-terminal cleavage/methylation domain-containing protein